MNDALLELIRSGCLPGQVKRTARLVLAVLLWLALVGLLTGCSSPLQAQTETPLSPPGTGTLAPAGTGAPALSSSIPTQTPLPTLTYTPLATNTPTPLFLVETGTPLPPMLEPITTVNAGRASGLASFRERTVTDLAWAPDGRTLAIATYYGISLYDAPSRTNLRALYPRGGGVVDLAFSPNGSWLLAGSRIGTEKTGYGSNLEMWWGPDWKPMGIVYGEQRGLSSLAFSPTSPHFVAAFTNLEISQNAAVYFWNTTTWEITSTLKTGTVLNLAFSPDGRYLATSPDRYAINVWDLKNMDVVYQLYSSFTGAVNSLVFSPDSTVLASGHYDGAIRLWDMATGGEIPVEMQVEGVVDSLAYSPDGRVLASGSSYENGFIHLWASPTGELLRTLTGHDHGVTVLAFSPDATLLASGSFDGVVRLWGIRP